jgi:hypothetical protein
MSESDAYKSLTSLVVLVTLASSFILSKRLDECNPVEETHVQNSRKAVMYLSGVALVIALVKAFSVSVPMLKMGRLPLDALYHGIALLVVLLNLCYVSTIKSDTCSAAGRTPASAITPSDLVANKNLMLTVLVLSAVSLVMVLKRGFYWAGQLVGKSAGKNDVVSA